MNVSGARRRANLSIAGEPAESAAAQVVARARIIMLISALTTLLAIAAVITAIGYRMFGGSGPLVATDEVIPLPKGARLISTSASAGRVAVLIEPSISRRSSRPASCASPASLRGGGGERVLGPIGHR
jgi:hypothetical protein